MASLSVRRVAVVTAAILLLVVIVGALLPSAWQVQREIVIRAPAAAVFARIDSPRRWPEWLVWYQPQGQTGVEFSGPESGPGATGRWRGRPFTGAVTITDSLAPRRLDYLALLAAGEFEVQGTIRLAETEAGTRVTWTASGRGGDSLPERYAAQALRIATGRGLEASLANLQRRLEPAR